MRSGTRDSGSGIRDARQRPEPRAASPAGGIECRWQIATASASAASCGDGRLRQAEQQLDHLLDLVLFGATVTDDRPLDRGRRVFHDRAPALDRRQHRDAARMPELQRAACVDGVKQAFNRDAVRRARGEQGRELAMDAGETLRKRVTALRR